MMTWLSAMAQINHFAPPDTMLPSMIGLIDFNDLLLDEGHHEEEEEFVEEHVHLKPLQNFHLLKEWANWEAMDTTQINPFRVDLRQLTDKQSVKLLYDPSCDYVHPVQGQVTSPFGPRRKRFHYGIDIDLQTGDPVMAAFEGVVRLSRYHNGYGHMVVIRHSDGIETLYAHLSERKVIPGDYVQAGDIIGLGGNTGRSRGSHLHFEVRYLGQQINPEELICFKEYACLSDEIAISSQTFSYLKSPMTYGTAAKAGSAQFYTVRKGDTLGKIAQKHKVSVNHLCKINRLSVKKPLKPGQKLRIR